MMDTPLIDLLNSLPAEQPAPKTLDVPESKASAAPKPLTEGEGRAAEFPIGALGERGSAMVKALHEKFQAPQALCAQSVLNAMNTSVAAWGRVQAIYGEEMPLSLYLITVAQSGERKTAVDGDCQKGILVYQKELEASLSAANERASDQEVDGSQSSAQILVNEPTLEGLLRTMSRGPGFACLSNDDAASFFGGHAMSPEKKQRSTGTLSQLWSGTAIVSPRADGRNAGVENIPLSMSLMFQPYLVPQVYGDREMVEQGLLARVLPCFPKSTMGTRFFKDCPDWASEEIQSFSKRVYETIHQVKAHRSAHQPPADQFAAQLPVLRLSKGARKELIAFHDEIEAGLAVGGKYENVRGFAGRATENATRIAGVVALFEDLSASEVPEEAAISACELMRFYISEFSHLVSLAKSQRNLSAAGDLGSWMAKRYGAGGVGYEKDISQFGPPAFRKKGARQEAMEVLFSHRWIERLPAGTVIDGSSRNEAFRVSDRIGDVI